MHHLEKSPLFCTTQAKLSIFVYVFHFHSKVEVRLRSQNLVISLSMSTFTQDWLFSKFYELILEDEIFIILIPITVSLLAVSIPADRNRVVLCIFDTLWYHPEWTQFLCMFPCMHPSSAVIPSFRSACSCRSQSRKLLLFLDLLFRVTDHGWTVGWEQQGD